MLKGEKWLLRYRDPKPDSRILLPLPAAMHRDLKHISELQGVLMSEIIRRAICLYMYSEVQRKPYIQLEGELRSELDILKAPKLL